MERKLIAFAECKFAASEVERSFSGYGAAFNNIDAYGDIIAPGAFKSAITATNKPLMFLNHDMRSLPIGTWLSLEEDQFGLKVEGSFLDTTTGQDAYKASKAGAISGLSIGYRPIEFERAKSDEPHKRLLKSVELLEISVVTFPANSQARIASVKSFTEDHDFANALINLGLSDDEAKDFLMRHASSIEAKYNRAAFDAAAQTLVKLLGA